MRQDIYNHNKYSDNLARKKRRRFFIWLFIIIITVLALVGLVIYLLFFSPWMKITDINIDGLETGDSGVIYNMIDSAQNKNYFGLLEFKPQSNIFFFNSEILRAEIMAYFPVIKNVDISKTFPHELKISVKERTPIGTWCFPMQCHYFDDSGVLWGEALRSSGSILLIVDDLRESDAKTAVISGDILKSIKIAITWLNTLGIKIKKIEIPEGEIGDFTIYTFSRYKLLFNNGSDIIGQIEILRILLNQKEKEFKPEYIDLRIDGRVYYK